MSPLTKAVLVGLLGVVTAMVIVAAVLALTATDEGAIELRLGDDRFREVDAVRGAERIETDGTPLIFGDLVGSDRPIYLQHLGSDPNEGWVAIEAVIADTDSCVAQWEPREEVFVDDCSDARYPPDGTGLITYEATVDDDGRVVVDLRAPG